MGDAGIGGDDEIRRGVAQRKLLVQGLRRVPEHPVAKADRPARRQVRSVRAAMREALEHSGQAGGIQRTIVEEVETGDPAHCVGAPRTKSVVYDARLGPPPTSTFPSCSTHAWALNCRSGPLVTPMWRSPA